MDYSDHKTTRFVCKYQDKVKETIDNLLETINEAGGDVNPQKLLEMDLLDFLVNVCSTNNIRFIYKKEDL